MHSEAEAGLHSTISWTREALLAVSHTYGAAAVSSLTHVQCAGAAAITPARLPDPGAAAAPTDLGPAAHAEPPHV